MCVTAHREDLGMVRVIRRRRMDVKLAETAAEGDVLLLRDRLVAREEHEMRR